MKRIVLLVLLICNLLLSGCERTSIEVVGGADGPTSILVTEKKTDDRNLSEINKCFMEYAVDESKLPILVLDIENPFKSDDRTLILEDSIQNSFELMIYEYYRNIMSGSYQEAKDIILDSSFLAATEAYEANFKNGMYYSKICIDEIDMIDMDDLEEIDAEKKREILQTLDAFEMEAFAIVDLEMEIQHNEKTLSMTPQVGDGTVHRYFLIGQKGEDCKMIDVYWEDFMVD